MLSKIRGTQLVTFGAIAAVAFGAGMAVAGQPHMRAALSDLMSARAELDTAEHNKGGHRVKAIELINSAIDEVQAGIDAAE
jgi:hypothetical protein